MNSLGRRINVLFRPRYLLYTNTACSGILMGLGDCGAQAIERYLNKNEVTHNWAQTGRMTLIGFALGPLGHAWYSWIDKFLPGVDVRSVSKKVFLDQAVCSPPFLFCFLMGSSLLEGKSTKNAWQLFLSKFWDIYKVELVVWPAAQAVNFAYVPPRFRFLYVSLIVIFYDTFLCYMQHKKVSVDCEESSEGSMTPSVTVPRISTTVSSLGAEKPS